MGKRLELHAKLKEILGSSNVYYQPPSTISMQYPAIVYSRDTMSSKYADNSVYTTETAYEVIIIDKDPDSSIIGKVAAMPTARFNRNYTVENLNHDAFTIHY